jgi:hypothetical protein
MISQSKEAEEAKEKAAAEVANQAAAKALEVRPRLFHAKHELN